ncbi:hypothetical protein [Streptomyces sp. NPDC059564]|uniref:hypothetical protein n=1 Tax=Streptomyces sp. NPDC059564 TaxID=3346865 RepID=UPI0036B15868
MVAVGCSAEEPEPLPAGPQQLSTGQVCAGLFTAAGAEALERVLGSTTFLLRDEDKNPDVRAVAQVMEDAYRAGVKIRDMPQSVCEISGAPRESHFPTARLMFTAYSKHAGDPADFPGVSDSGVRVSTVAKWVYLSYDCASPRVGSTPDIPLRIRLLFQDQWDGSKGAAALGPDYLKVTHSAALAVAKELGCVNDGGLSARAEELPAPVSGTGVAPSASATR